MFCKQCGTRSDTTYSTDWTCSACGQVNRPMAGPAASVDTGSTPMFCKQCGAQELHALGEWDCRECGTANRKRATPMQIAAPTATGIAIAPTHVVVPSAHQIQAGDRLHAASTTALTFLVLHRVRLIAGTLLALWLAALILFPEALAPLLLLVPFALGAVVPLIGHTALSRPINGWDRSFERSRAQARESGGKFARFVKRPSAATSLWIWSKTSSVVDEHVQAGLRLTGVIWVCSITVAILAAIAYAVLIIVMVLLLLAFAFWLMSVVLSGSSTTTSSGGSGAWKRRLAGKRFVKEGMFFDSDTGMKFNEEGQLLKEGFFFDEATGVKINDAGQFVKEGLFFDEASGMKLNDEGQFVKEGLFFDEATGTRINDEGQIVKEGWLFDENTGTRLR